ncbi:DUF309 domain-containing protein [Spirillospora sp. NPDC029432]|uniref:DUF309 domain-containing protein n=1 Tax=Spirillospora sp. NPDC029432 TaxID=3154599 RepID=UPI003454C805
MRDRDETGRPRNARPRDAYGRPLPRGAAGTPTMPDDLTVTPTEALEQAQRLLDEDRPFHAHEVLEAAWKAAPEEERELWRGLAQVAVGITHVRRGNARGARALLERAADRIEEHSRNAPYGIDATGIVAEARRIAETAENAADGPGLRIALRLTRSGRPET